MAVCGGEEVKLKRQRVWGAGCLVALAALSPAGARAQFPPAPGTGSGLAETIEAIDAARVTTRILYVTAHPDDESAAVLTYLARGLHADVALLSLTRGEGGQNALGPEQAPQLGLIRTQELLAATHGYGVKLFFTRAKDFGYSKTPEETMKVWGDQVLDDMVRVIRTFRPHIVINNWGGARGGHGHHQAAGILTPKAVQLAADPEAFQEQFQEGLRVGGEHGARVMILDLERGSDAPKGYVLPLDEVSPLWGKTWREIGLDAFVNHRTQGIAGFLNSPFLRRPIALRPEDGASLDPALLAAPLAKLAEKIPTQREPIEKADRSLAAAREAAERLDWARAAQEVAQAGQALAAAQQGAVGGELRRVQQRIDAALALVAGLEITAQADRSELVAGETFTVRAQARCRAQAACALEETRIGYRGNLDTVKVEGDEKNGFRFTVKVRSDAPLPPEPRDWMLPEPAPLIEVRQDVSIGSYGFAAFQPVAHLTATSTRVDKVPLRIVPAYTLAVEPKQAIEVLGNPRQPFDVLLRVHSYSTRAAKVTVGLDVPKGWTTSAPVMVEFAGAGDQYAKLTVTPPEKLAAGSYTIGAYAKRGEEKFATSLEPLPSLPTELWEEPTECVVQAFDIAVPEKLRVGYITAENEPIPQALERLGIRVELLDAAALAFGDLAKYDAIVVGVRAYELRSDLAPANQRLLRYVEQGGTLVVQYERGFVWDRLKPAPYPATIGDGPRITDESSPVRFLKPDDVLLNFPNKISQEDFRGWVQERGLYFWNGFDPRYQAVLAMNDPGESEQTGGLVYGRYGKGTYIYTGLAFFRQLPEGVAGAYRLFVNLLSQSRAMGGARGAE
jgi:LmbE family N-acetylglucosaminyl deacetylase